MDSLRIELSEATLRQLVVDYIKSRSGQEIEYDAVHIQVKSKQNYKAEWEAAAFRAVVDVAL